MTVGSVLPNAHPIGRCEIEFLTGLHIEGHVPSVDIADRIYADALYHQVTPNQAAALKALADTGRPEFWIAAAHSNGIFGKDDLIANYALKNKAQLDSDILRHVPTYEEQFQHEVMIAGLGCLTFVALIGVWIARRTS